MSKDRYTSEDFEEDARRTKKQINNIGREMELEDKHYRSKFGNPKRLSHTHG